MTAEAPLLTAAEVADLLAVSVSTVHRWARDGTLPSITLPTGTRRFDLRDVLADAPPGAP
jgi:excisionase family DNA binding protein